MHWMLCLLRLSIQFVFVFVCLTQHLIQSTMRCENSTPLCIKWPLTPPKGKAIWKRTMWITLFITPLSAVISASWEIVPDSWSFVVMVAIFRKIIISDTAFLLLTLIFTSLPGFTIQQIFILRSVPAALVPPPSFGVQILSISCNFWGKFGKIVCWRPSWRVVAPASGKSWIRHW